MIIRKTRPEEFDTLQTLFAIARRQMKEAGNPSQWKDDRPDPELVRLDIERGTSYVLEENGRIVATFALCAGSDPTYSYIEGQWLSDEPYLTIHRIAKFPEVKGVFSALMNFAKTRSSHIRIDTHEDNAIMRHLIEQSGFEECGIIYTDDGTPRLAFEYLK